MIVDLKNSFQQRVPTHRLSDKDLLRIASAYRKAKADERSTSMLYRVGNEWLPIYSQFMTGFIEVLDHGDVINLRSLLENFFREKFSNGLHGLHFEMVERYMNPDKPVAESDLLAYAETLKSDLQLLFRSVPDLDLSSIRVPIVGNPYGYEIDGQFFYGLHFLYFANKIAMLVRQPSQRIVELGAGYGGLPWALRDRLPNSRYIDFDLPEVLAIASFYIMSAYPSARVGLFGEVDLQKDDLDQYDFVFMPNFEITRLGDDWADLSFNSWSLAEMDPGPIANYIGHLCRVARTYLFHVNHTNFSKVGADLFPVDYKKFRLLHRAPAMWGKSAHRNNFVDEHEFIYRADKVGHPVFGARHPVPLN